MDVKIYKIFLSVFVCISSYVSAEDSIPTVLQDSPPSELIAFVQNQVKNKMLSLKKISADCEKIRDKVIDLKPIKSLSMTKKEMMVAISFWHKKNLDQCYRNEMTQYIIAVHKLRGIERHFKVARHEIEISIDTWFDSYHGSIDIEYQYSKIPHAQRTSLEKIFGSQGPFDFIRTVESLGL